MESKAQQSGTNTPRDQSIGHRNQILITATLLYPDAEFQVRNIVTFIFALLCMYYVRVNASVFVTVCMIR